MSRWWNQRRFDLVELAAIALLVGLSVWRLGYGARQPLPYTELGGEAARLKAAYGPDRQSENFEEWIIRDFFRDRRGGFFVDVGANHYKRFSNTYYLEEHLGWSGIAIDPHATFDGDYRRYRPRTRFFPLFVSDKSNETARLYVLDGNPLITSASEDFTRAFGKNVVEMSAPTVALSDLLDRLTISQIDLLSVDVELSEPKVLSGFDVERFRPALVCIEAHPQVRQQILAYFARHRYMVVGKYLRVDVQNLYFEPLNHAAD
jgi:FkbM family methyltransferase